MVPYTYIKKRYVDYIDIKTPSVLRHAKFFLTLIFIEHHI